MKTIQLRFVVLFILLAAPVFADDLTQTSAKESTESTVSSKILGGVESKSGDWPWVVALLDSNESDIYQAQYCSGVLIGESWILTAAHCVLDRTAGSIDVAIGAFDLSTFTGSRSTISTIQVHPQYNSDFQYDIALLRLSVPSSQPKIALFAGDSVESVPPSLLGEMTTAIGWGHADDGSSWYYPEKLRQVNLPVVNNSLCNDAYSTSLIASQMCAGYYEGKDVCNGDSGGPIMSYIDGEWLHVGLVSYGATCQDYGGWYGVYTRTSEFVDYIKGYVPDVSIHSRSSGSRAGRVSGVLFLLLKK
jgi:secreted trypsin-like serine protease